MKELGFLGPSLSHYVDCILTVQDCRRSVDMKAACPFSYNEFCDSIQCLRALQSLQLHLLYLICCMAFQILDFLRPGNVKYH